MKITTHDENKAVTLQIEGTVTRALVPELDRAWHGLVPFLGERKLVVDLRGVTFLDASAKTILAEIHAQTGAEFRADTPLTKYFADEARQGPRENWKVRNGRIRRTS